MEDDIKIISGCPGGNCPPSIPSIRGPTSGLVDEELEFYFVTEDPDDDQVYYMIDFDGDQVGYLGPYSSGVEISRTYTFDEEGTYKIKAKAKDDKDLESGWTPTGYEHIVEITEEPVEEANLSITIPMIHFGEISATVKNIGEDDLTNISWEFNGTGGILGKAIVNDTGTIASLDIEKETTIVSTIEKTGLIKFAFGKISGTVKLNVGDYEVEEEFQGYIIGKLVLILPTFEI